MRSANAALLIKNSGFLGLPAHRARKINSFRNSFRKIGEGSVGVPLEIHIGEVVGGEVIGFWLLQVGGWAIVTPQPPGLPTGAAVELLPLAAMVFGEYGRSPINPHLLGFGDRGTAGWAAYIQGMNSFLSPVGWYWSERIHERFHTVSERLVRVASFSDTNLANPLRSSSHTVRSYPVRRSAPTNKKPFGGKAGAATPPLLSPQMGSLMLA